MKIKADRTAVPYSYLIDNIKVILIFLVVFNHIIAFQLVKTEEVIRYIWYAITIFHMPAFVFISGYLSKKPQNVLKNVKNLLIPYILGYTLTWYSEIWLEKSMDYELLRPTGTAMWYLLALLVYRLTIEAMGKLRFIVPLSIIFALWAGTRPEFTTYLSASRIVVFFPFFVAGYLWKSDYIREIRKFVGKWVLIPVSAVLLWAIPHYMIGNDIGIAIFRGNHSYKLCGLTNTEGIIIRLLMYLVSFLVIYTMLALIPDRKLPLTYIGRHTMGIYFFHYPLLIVMNGLFILQAEPFMNVWVLLGVSFLFILVLGSLPVDFIYTGILNLITFLLFKKDKIIRDEGLEEEYDSDEDKYEQLNRRRKAIEELAATLETEEEQKAHTEVVNLDEEEKEYTLEELMEELEETTSETDTGDLLEETEDQNNNMQL